MQERGAQRLGIEPHARADLGHADRMDDEVLARVAALVGVVHARVHERLLDPVAVDRGGGVMGVLLDDREQVAEQPLLGLGQLGALELPVRVGIRDAIDLRPRVANSADPGAASLPFEPVPSCWRARLSLLEMICAAQESSTVLVPLSVDPVRRRALERCRSGARDRQGRQVPVEADELQLREDPDQPCRQTCRATVRTVSAKQALELLAGRPSPRREAPVKATSEARRPYSSSCICCAKRSSGSPHAKLGKPVAARGAAPRRRARRRIERDQLVERRQRLGSRSSAW